MPSAPYSDVKYLDSEEHQVPSLAYLRRANAASPIELIIVEPGKQTIFSLSDTQVLRMVAEGSHFLCTRKEHP